MKRILFALVCLIITDASAQTVENDLVGLGMSPEVASYLASIIPAGAALDNNVFLKSDNAAGSSTINVLKVDGTDDTVLNADSGDVIKLSVATTPIAQFGSTGFSTDLPFASDAAPRLAPYTATLAATPAAGTNDFKIGINIVPTAAANTAALLPTPLATGQRVTIVNTMANAVRIKAGGTNTINGSAAGAYVPLAAAAVIDCETTTATNWFCGYRAVPTPAGP